MIEPKGSVRVQGNTRVDDSQARKTVLIVSTALLAIAAWNLYRGRHTVVLLFGVVGTLLLVTGTVHRPSARLFHKAWMKFAVALGYINSRVVLTLMFYGLLTPYGFILRLLKRDPLRRHGEPKASYWVLRKRTRQTREQFERLF